MGSDTTDDSLLLPNSCDELVEVEGVYPTAVASRNRVRAIRGELARRSDTEIPGDNAGEPAEHQQIVDTIRIEPRVRSSSS